MLRTTTRSKYSSGADSRDSRVVILERYMREVSRFPMLDRAQEAALAEHYHATQDSQARETLINSNLRFVAKIAYRYASYQVDIIDLIQEGNIGLITAVDRFNPDHGNRLLTYAVWWIKATIQAYISGNWAMVRVLPSSQQRKLLFGRHRDTAEPNACGPDASAVEPAGDAGETRAVVGWHRDASAARRTLDLCGPVATEGRLTLGDMLADREAEGADETIGRREVSAVAQLKIAAVRATLSDKESVILDRRILADEPATLQELSDAQGVSRERIRQVEAGVMRKLERKLRPLMAAA